MTWLLEVALSNAVVATVAALAIAAIAAVAHRLSHRPAIVHALWLIVLLKLVTPPLLSIPLDLERQQEAPIAAEPSLTAVASAAPIDLAVLKADLQRMRVGLSLYQALINLTRGGICFSRCGL